MLGEIPLTNRFVIREIALIVLYGTVTVKMSVCRCVPELAVTTGK
jgi:hypothetical protein